MEEHFKKIQEKLRNSEKRIGEMLRKFLGNFTLNLGQVFRKSMDFQNKFPERLKVKFLE